MDQTIPATASDTDVTQPPAPILRHPTPTALFREMPQIGEVLQNRPLDEESYSAFLGRLGSSTTPEEAVTFAAFAIEPKMAIWWGYECLRTLPDTLSPADREMMEMVATWTLNPSNDNRYITMREALFAPVCTPAVRLGLAVGWSGGPIAPNDPARVSPGRAARSINAAILSALARSDITKRGIHLARFIDLAQSLLRGS